MADTDTELSESLRQAIVLLQAGQSVEAEELMLQAAQAAEQSFGPDDPRTAAAFNELGSVLLNVHNLPAAIEAYRRACAGPMPAERQPLRDRLTFLMNLGMALHLAKQFQEAEEVFLQGLQGRARCYGTRHPGYAFGLEPLATLLMEQGRLDEAIDMFAATVDNFWQNGHPRVASALALRAEALKRAEVLSNPFAGIEPLPDSIVADIADHVVQRQERADSGVLSKVLQDLMPELKRRFGSDHDLVVNALTWIANFESTQGKNGDVAARMQAIRELIAIYHRQEKPREYQQALQGLALALGDAGRTEDAVACYRAAVASAAEPALRSQVRRNFGLLLAELHRDQEAEAELRGAVDDGTGEQRARSQIALGIFHQHRGRLAEARPLLSAALDSLPPAQADAVVGRSHWQALETGRSCGCENQGEGLAAAFRDYVLSQLPSDLVERLEVHLENNDFKVEIQLRRALPPQEMDHLNRIINHALAGFRQRLGVRA